MKSIENKLVKIINAKSTLVTIICGESSGFIMLSQQLRNMIFFFFFKREFHEFNPRSLIQKSETLSIELIGTHRNMMVDFN